MKTGTPPTRDWLMKAVEMEADCDISAGPVMPRVKASSALRATHGQAKQGRSGKTATAFRPSRHALAKA